MWLFVSKDTKFGQGVLQLHRNLLAIIEIRNTWRKEGSSSYSYMQVSYYNDSHVVYLSIHFNYVTSF